MNLLHHFKPTKMTTKIKKAIICQNITQYTLREDLTTSYLPKSGDVAIFEVLELGKHTRMQCSTGKNRHIYPGDYLMAVFGNRYATNQLEGYVPDAIYTTYEMLGQGGVMGKLASLHHRFELKGPTTLRLVGYAADKQGKVINTHYYKTEKTPFTGLLPINQPQIILSLGGSMDSGKTTTAGFLCRGLNKAGKKTAYIKLTGTVYSKDKDFVFDCGADMVIDFSNFGFPSTYMYSEKDILDLYQVALAKVANILPDYIVIEIADGLLQRETNMLIRSAPFMQTVDHIIYSDGNSTGALCGLQLLQNLHLTPFALCGRFTAAPLLIQEVKACTNIPILTLEDISNATILNYIEKSTIKASTKAKLPLNGQAIPHAV